MEIRFDIEQAIENVIAERERNGKAPAQCDLHDIIRMMVPELTDAMRQLVRGGKYEGAITINKVPVLRRKE